MSIENILRTKGRNFIGVRADNTVRDAVDVLHHHRIGAVLIVDPNGALQGILSERDVVSALAGHGGNALDNSVESLMTRNVVTANETDTIELVMERMTSGRFRHMPIVKDGRVVGVVSIGDMVKSRLETMESEHRALKDYIASA